MTKEKTAEGRDLNVEEPEKKDPDKDDVIDSNIDELNEEDLNRIEVDDEGTVILKPPKNPEKSAGDEPITDDDGKPIKPAGDEPITGEKGEGEKKVADEKKEGDEEIVHDPLKDTQTAYHQEREKNVDLQKRLTGAQKRIIELEQPKKPTYTEEQLNDMKQFDVDKYSEAMQEIADYEREKGDHNVKVKDLDADILETGKAIAQSETVESIVLAANDLNEEVKGRVGVGFKEQTQEFQDFVGSPEFQETISVIDGNPHRFYEEDGSIAKDTILMVYNYVTKDKSASASRSDGRSQATKTIEQARHTGSNLDKLPKDDQTSQRTKKTEDLTQQEISDMGPKELEDTLKEAETQGMTD